MWTGIPEKNESQPESYHILSETEFEGGPTISTRLPESRTPRQFTLEKLVSVDKIREWLDLFVVIAQTHYLHTFILTHRELTSREALKLQYDPVSFLLGEILRLASKFRVHLRKATHPHESYKILLALARPS
jgi:hypothetical protein